MCCQGDMNEAIEPYIKDERNVDKVSRTPHLHIILYCQAQWGLIDCFVQVRATAVDSCKRLGRYRMPFCWTAIELAKIFRGIPLTGKYRVINECLDLKFIKKIETLTVPFLRILLAFPFFILITSTCQAIFTSIGDVVVHWQRTRLPGQRSRVRIRHLPQ